MRKPLLLILVLALAPLAATAQQHDVPILLEMLQGPDPKLQQTAHLALVKLGERVLPELRILAQDPGTAEPVRQRALHTIARINRYKVLIKLLLEDKDPVRRYEAATQLSSLPGPMNKIVPALGNALTDKSLEVRQSVARALRVIGKKSRAAMPALTKAFEESTDAIVRDEAARALGQIGKPALPVLLKGLTKGNSATQAYAANALGEMGHEARPAVPHLLALASDKNATLRRAGVTNLGRVGLYTGKVVDALVRAAADKDPRVGYAAAVALNGLGTPEEKHIQPLVSLLRSPLPYARETACQMLGRSGAAGVKGAQALIGALHDSEDLVRRAARQTLSTIAKQTTDVDVLRKIQQALKDTR